MLTEREERALLRVRVLRTASYRCAKCGTLASAIAPGSTPGEHEARCPRHMPRGGAL